MLCEVQAVAATGAGGQAEPTTEDYVGYGARWGSVASNDLRFLTPLAAFGMTLASRLSRVSAASSKGQTLRQEGSSTAWEALPFIAGPHPWMGDGSWGRDPAFAGKTELCKGLLGGEAGPPSTLNTYGAAAFLDTVSATLLPFSCL